MDMEVLETEAREVEWEESCEIRNTVGVEVLGKNTKPHPKLWLVRGKQDRLMLDEAVKMARQEDHEARTNTDRNEQDHQVRKEESRKKPRATPRMRKDTLKRWE